MRAKRQAQAPGVLGGAAAETSGSADKPVLLLSDLHLPVEPSPLRDGFLAFLAGPARAAEAVYILGDLFDVWVGDDLGVADFSAECAALKKLVASGVYVGFLAGNRDFMVGRQWAASTGVEQLPDPCTVDLADGPILLSHGDIFCTDDRAYQRYRRVVHNPVMQWLFMHMPRAWRRAVGRKLRGHSDARKQYEGASTISDVNVGAVQAVLLRYGQTRLIHGHTHRPACHAVDLPGATAGATGITGSRIVLADWHADNMEYLHCTTAGCRRVRLPFAPTKTVA